MSQLAGLANELEYLEKQAWLVDQHRRSSDNPLFDSQLFHCRSIYLQPCIAEAKQTFQCLINEQEKKTIASERAVFLSQKLSDQIMAIRQVIAAHPISAEKQAKLEQLAQHQEWERRLIEMIKAKESLVTERAVEQTYQVKHEITQLKQRLARCLVAKNQIEEQISEKGK